MPFPESKRVIYRKNPLAEVICQLKFPTILAISAEEPADFQERIRSKYPLYRRAEGAEVPREISDLLSRVGVKFLEDGTHTFLADDSSRFISLNKEFVAVTDKGYVRWEEFRERVELAKQAVEDVYQPAFYSRVGLRYQDIIDKASIGLAKASWDELLNPPIAGILGATEVRNIVAHMRTEALLELSDVIPGGQVRILHGLAPSANGRHQYFIDADFFTEERSGHDDVFAVLDHFNRLAGNFFRWTITPKLKRALHPFDIG